jgi:hypothetical protein
MQQRVRSRGEQRTRGADPEQQRESHDEEKDADRGHDVVNIVERPRHLDHVQRLRRLGLMR